MDKIWLDSVKCDPSQKETLGNPEPAFALKDCDHSEWGGSGLCDHSNDVGVVCGGKYRKRSSLHNVEVCKVRHPSEFGSLAFLWRYAN